MIGISALDDYPWVDVYYDEDLTTGANDGSSEADAWQTFSAMDSGAQKGHRVNMKRAASTVDLGNTTYTLSAGDTSRTIWYRGYGSTIGDGVRWQGSFSGSTGTLNASLGNVIFSDIELTGSNNTAVFNAAGGKDQTAMYRCRIEATSGGKAVDSDGAVFVECEFVASIDHCLVGSGSFIGCSFTGSGHLANADTIDHLGCRFFACTFKSNSAKMRDCIQLAFTGNESADLAIVENSMWQGLNGILIDDIRPVQESAGLIMNNAVWDCDVGIATSEVTVQDSIFFTRNAVGGSDTSDYSWGSYESLSDDIALTGDPFVDAANGDFTPDSTAGEGAVLQNGGTIGLIGGSGANTVASAYNLGATRHGPDDAGDPVAIISEADCPPSSGGAGISSHDMGVLPITKTSEVS